MTIPVSFHLRYDRPADDAVVNASVVTVPQPGDQVDLWTRHGWLHDLRVHAVAHDINYRTERHRITVSVDVPGSEQE